MAWAGSRRARQWGAVAALAAVLAGHGAITDWQRGHAFMVNATDSLPNWAFWVRRDGQPERGGYMFFTPPPHPLIRRYFPPSAGPFGKRVLGMPGDVVTHDGALVRVNGVGVARMKPRTRRGEALTPGPTGVVPAGCFYAGTGHPDGFDSRYAEIGWACRGQVLGTGTPIL